MRVLLVHNYYKLSGGEDKVFEEEKQLLLEYGHEVECFVKHNEEQIRGILSKLKLLFTTHKNASVEREFQALISRWQPDVVHVHNFFPLISPSIFYACHHQNIPVVMTLHNYRLIYPNGLMYHNGKVDLRTFPGSAYKVVFDRVYRNSFLQTLVVSHLIEFHKKRQTWNKYVDKFICLTEFSKNLFEKWGIHADRLVVKPNTVKPVESQNRPIQNQFLFVGRLSEEKGVKQLIEAWVNQKIPHRLLMIGEGPLKLTLEKIADGHSNIEFLGKRNQKEVLSCMSESTALVFPSLWYEGLPMTIIESFSVGLPVLSTSHGNQGSIVRDGITGMLFSVEGFTDLGEKVNLISADKVLRKSLGDNARAEFSSKYDQRLNHDYLMSIYREVQKNA